MIQILKAPEDVKPVSTIDVKGLNCPLPILRIKKNITKLSVGDILQVNGMHVNFLPDIKGWCERNGHSFIGEKEIYGRTSFFLKKG